MCFYLWNTGLVTGVTPQNLGKESKQHRNLAKFELFCFQRYIITSLVPPEFKQAVIPSQEGKQAIKSKEGAIKC